jgi:hypothetical protein
LVSQAGLALSRGRASKPAGARVKTPELARQSDVLKNLFGLCGCPFSPVFIGVFSIPLARKLGHDSDWNRHSTRQAMAARPQIDISFRFEREQSRAEVLNIQPCISRRQRYVD